MTNRAWLTRLASYTRGHLRDALTLAVASGNQQAVADVLSGNEARRQLGVFADEWVAEYRSASGGTRRVAA